MLSKTLGEKPGDLLLHATVRVRHDNGGIGPVLVIVGWQIEVGGDSESNVVGVAHLV